MENILEKIVKNRYETDNLLNELETYINDNFRIITNNSGTKRSLTEVREYFRIKIPDEISFAILVDLSSEIAKKYQQATYLRDKQKVKLAILDQTRLEAYNRAYQDAREQSRRELGKPLAAESCKVAAVLETKGLEDSVNSQSVIVGFWDGICKTLVEVRKLCETMSIALSGDAKIQRDFIIKGDK